jgi:hypothetical protein
VGTGFGLAPCAFGTSVVGSRLKTAASRHFVRSLGCCGRDLLAVSLSAFDPQLTFSATTRKRALFSRTARASYFAGTSRKWLPWASACGSGEGRRHRRPCRSGKARCLHPELQSGRNGHRGDAASRFRRSHRLRFLTHGVQLDGDRPITEEPRHFADHRGAL